MVSSRNLFFTSTAIILILSFVGILYWFFMVPQYSANSSSQRTKSAITEEEPTPVSATAALKVNADLELVTSSMHDPRLALGLLLRLEKMVLDPKQDPLIRNNAANALVGQDKKDPELWRLFLKMAQDPNEDEVWRDYCLQFLGACVPFASEPKTVTDYLATVAREEGIDRAGTAAIMLVRLMDDKMYQPPADWLDVLSARAVDPKLPVPARLSMLALVGRNGSATNAVLLRHVIVTTKDDDLLRVAIAGLGIIGNTSDLPLVNAGLKHPNKAVILAAQGAQRRLANRFPVSATNGSLIPAPPKP